MDRHARDLVATAARRPCTCGAKCAFGGHWSEQVGVHVDAAVTDAELSASSTTDGRVHCSASRTSLGWLLWRCFGRRLPLESLAQRSYHGYRDSAA